MRHKNGLSINSYVIKIAQINYEKDSYDIL